MSVLSNSNLLPFRQYADAEVIQLWSADFTGQAGTLCTIQPTSQVPGTEMGAYTTSAPLQAFQNVGNYAFNNPRKVRPAAVGDNIYQMVGFTLYTVATQDENQIPLRGQPYNQTLERGFVQTGFTVPILARGIITIKSSQVTNAALPGDVGVAGAGGTLVAITPTAAQLITGAYYSTAVGKFLSSSGTAFNGYYQFKVQL
jgi:hypothetical protein